MTADVDFNVAAAVDEAMTWLELFDANDRDQKHLPQELQISRITAMKAADCFLSDVFPSISYCT